MAHVEKRLVWILAAGWLAFGSGIALAFDGPAPENDEVKFSPSVGADRFLKRGGAPASRVRMSRNGRRIAIAHGRSLLSGYELWDGDSGRRLLDVNRRVPDFYVPNTAPGHFIFSCGIDESGRWIVTGGCFNFGYIAGPLRAHLVHKGSLADAWDAESGQLARTFVLDDRRLGAWGAISRNGEHVACIDHSLNAKLWDRETGRALASVTGALPPKSEVVDYMVFSDNLTRFAVLVRRQSDSHYRASIYFCDLPSKKIRLIGPPKDEKNWSWYRKLAIRGDGREVAAYRVGEHGRELVLLDFETGAIRSRLPQPIAERISFMGYGPGGRTVVLGFVDGHLNLVDLQNGARVELRASDGPVCAATYLADRGLVRVVAERRVIRKEDGSEAHYAGPMRIADFAVRFPSPSP